MAWANAPMVPPTADEQLVAGEAETARQRDAGEAETARRRETTAQKSAIATLEKHGVNYTLELTEERKAQLEPLPNKQGKAHLSSYVGVGLSRGSWQAKVNQRSVGSFAAEYEAGKAVTVRMIELAQGYTPPAAQPRQPVDLGGRAAATSGSMHGNSTNHLRATAALDMIGAHAATKLVRACRTRGET